MSKPNPEAKKLPMRALCERFGVSSKTIDRWTETGVLPKPLRINRYRYWDLGEIEAFERARMAAQETSSAA
jgi:predicted DNA-binding transcriptional regulator AlpA